MSETPAGTAESPPPVSQSGQSPSLQPLAGKRIAITRPPEQAASLKQRLEALGAQVVTLSAIAIAPSTNNAALNAVIQRLSAYDWLVFTSVNGVQAFADRLAANGKSWADRGAARIAAIGPATASALERQGAQVDLTPDEYIAEGLLAGLNGLGAVRGKRFLLARADIARQTLAAELRAQGAQVDEASVYRTVTQPIPTALLERALRGDERVDAITFTSSSTVRGLVQSIESAGWSHTEVLEGIALAAIGPITATTLEDYHLPRTIVAQVYTIPGLVRAIVAYFTNVAPERQS
ncbi:MAG: uroporphyrinogen-III synthase [Ktedonobacterales bacterium]